ncbi:unnamed protein product [Paramecium octaurelia]|uniref:Uncharacterized protein n=1 Tax=Paramecium octaurelia TaxID=43137 RepID=A0A8S1XEA3_PAROT|nr:unnamed protein product [Paramecium octaurelia]
MLIRTLKVNRKLSKKFQEDFTLTMIRHCMINGIEFQCIKFVKQSSTLKNLQLFDVMKQGFEIKTKFKQLAQTVIVKKRNTAAILVGF